MAAAARCLSGTAREPARLELADILRAHGEAFERTHGLSVEQRRTLHAILRCRTAALAPTGDRWVDTARDFLFPRAVLRKLFRGKFLAGLVRLRKERGVGRHLNADAFDALLRALYEMDWNVYAKAPFAGPMQIFRYLGQYTHRVGISNHRLLSFDERGVTFRTRGKDRVTVDAIAFIERFLLHILPHRFVKIRHSGLLANGRAVQRRERARRLLVAHSPVPPRVDPARAPLAYAGWQELLRALTGIDLAVCRSCKRRAVVRFPLPPATARGRARAPPVREVAA